MDLTFASFALACQCNRKSDCVAVHGSERASVLMRRLLQMNAVANLEDLLGMPCGFVGPEGPKAILCAADLDVGYRLVFEPHCNPIPRMSTGRLDVRRVVKVRILRLEKCHGT